MNESHLNEILAVIKKNKKNKKVEKEKNKE